MWGLVNMYVNFRMKQVFQQKNFYNIVSGELYTRILYSPSSISRIFDPFQMLEFVENINHFSPNHFFMSGYRLSLGS